MPRKRKINYGSVLVAAVGIFLVLYAMLFLSSCQSSSYAADKTAHIVGFSCTISLGEIMILMGIGILVFVVGLAGLSSKRN